MLPLAFRSNVNPTHRHSHYFSCLRCLNTQSMAAGFGVPYDVLNQPHFVYCQVILLMFRYNKHSKSLWSGCFIQFRSPDSLKAEAPLHEAKEDCRLCLSQFVWHPPPPFSSNMQHCWWKKSTTEGWTDACLLVVRSQRVSQSQTDGCWWAAGNSETTERRSLQTCGRSGFSVFTVKC